jgi:D-alanyl-D-alanine-carboxypeptidase/D-alanyl-D-alanine-endopeptidase
MTKAAPLLLLALWTVATTPSDADIRKILVDRIDGMHRSVGIVVGVIGPDGRRVIAYGAPDKAGGRALDGDTVFEIGSVSKVFTNLMLADMVQHGEVALDDPIAKYLPPTVKIPQRNSRQITLVDLATHTSGLPRLPTNFAPKGAANPYNDYTVDNLYAFLSGYSLTRDIGTTFEYSNLGGGLLGHLLALRAGTDYETLLRTRITGPLGMRNTAIALPPDLQARLTPGHDEQLKPAAAWDFPAVPGAGAIRSTVNDMLTFVGANLGFVSSPLAPAMKRMLAVNRPAGSPGLTIGLGWFTRLEPPKIIWHNGGTGGYRSWIGFDPAARIGVVVLSNTNAPEGVDDIGGHILDPSIDPLTAADLKPKAHKQVAIDPAVLDRYVGRYQLVPNFVLTITKNGSRLFAQATGQGRFEIFPEAEKAFFAKVADIQISFIVPDSGNASGLVLRQQGIDTPANRIQ